MKKWQGCGCGWLAVILQRWFGHLEFLFKINVIPGGWASMQAA
jgi:hypothetical protein